jgi:hypothetical protein
VFDNENVGLALSCLREWGVLQRQSRETEEKCHCGRIRVGYVLFHPAVATASAALMASNVTLAHNSQIGKWAAIR